MRIFISYSSKVAPLCERLRLALEQEGHSVFVDREDLEPGQPFDAKLRHAIEDCELLIFLVSPESVASGSYALAELTVAQRRWRRPGGHVLPVVVAPTPKESIPPYLRAVTLLEPQGDPVAEVVTVVARRRRWSWRPVAALALAVLLLITGAGLAWQHQRQQHRQEELALAAAQQMCDSGDFSLAWQRFEQGLQGHSGARRLRAAREDCGMRWLREIRVREGQETFTDIVNRVVPVLSDGLATATGQRAADLRAHLGWGDFLRTRDGASNLDPAAHYQKALSEDPGNVYAHAMWGHFIMTQRGQLAEARRHFEAALASGRERAYVRELQFAGLLYFHQTPGATEALRAANEMRRAGESLNPDLTRRLWDDVFAQLVDEDSRVQVLGAVPGRDALETFLWLYPQRDSGQPERMWRYYAGVLEEAAGDASAARARLEGLRAEMQRDTAYGSLMFATQRALQRLGSK